MTSQAKSQCQVAHYRSNDVAHRNEPLTGAAKAHPAKDALVPIQDRLAAKPPIKERRNLFSMLYTYSAFIPAHIASRRIRAEWPIADEFPSCRNLVLQTIERSADYELYAIAKYLDAVVRDLRLGYLASYTGFGNQLAEVLVIFVKATLTNKQCPVNFKAAGIDHLTAEPIIGAVSVGQSAFNGLIIRAFRVPEKHAIQEFANGKLFVDVIIGQRG